MTRIKERNNMLIQMVLIIYISIHSGSMFQMIYASNLHIFECIVLLCISFWGLYKKRGIVIKKNLPSLFILMLTIISLIDIVVWSEFSMVTLYLANLASIVICYSLASVIDFDHWQNTFINVLTFLAIVSLLGWVFRERLLMSPLGFSFEGTWSYKSFILFNIIKIVPDRNCGIFWEPGMYQGFLNLAILLLIQKEHKRFVDALKMLLFSTTILTTYSTTGYAVMVILYVFLIYKVVAKKVRVLADIFLAFSALIFIMTDGFADIFAWALSNLPSIVTQKIVDQNVSFITRIYTVLFDLVLSIRYPFGVGRTQVTQLISGLGEKYGVSVLGRTSTLSTAFVYFGVFGGITYCILWIRGIYRFVEKRKLEFAFVLLVLFLLLNSEPMLFHLFFGTTMFIWNKEKRTADIKTTSKI